MKHIIITENNDSQILFNWYRLLHVLRWIIINFDLCWMLKKHFEVIIKIQLARVDEFSLETNYKS